LEGLNGIDPDLLYETLSDADANVRASAVTLYQRFLALETMAPLVVADLADLADDHDPLVRLQLVQTLGMIDLVEADRLLEPILEAASQEEELLDGLLSGFAGREAEFLAVRLKQQAWNNPQVWRQRLLGNCAKIMWRQRDPVAVLRFCQLLSTIPVERSWQLVALLEGIQDPPPPAVRRFPTAAEVAANGAPTTISKQMTQTVSPRGRLRPLTLHTVPDGLDMWRNTDDERLARAAQRFAEKLVWPGKDGRPLPIKKPLTPSQQKLFEIGRREYLTICAGCHHEAGYGLAAKGPELRESQWLQDPRRLIRIVLHGLEGPITVNGNLYNESNRLSMPGMQKSLSDEQVAGVLTYARREFVDDATPIDIETVAVLRKHLNSRTRPWTEQELLELVP
jgi:mono/diheme cytochrome c family protein